jgi:hypothetical protein
MKPLAILAVTLAAALMASPEPAPAADTGYACSFTDGSSFSYGKGQFTPEKVAPLSFTIGSIDEKAQTATLDTGRGTSALKLAQAVNATHFLEVANEGYLNVTTIYEKDDATGLYPAVHSRHLALLGQPIVTQYHGFCRPKG